MVQRSGVRIILKGRPTSIQLKALRELFPAVRQVPPATLRARLTTSPVSVVGHIEGEQADHLQERANATGIGLEFFALDDYTAEYVRHTLPAAPPAWARAQRSIEVVFRPAFSPEVIIRLWADKSGVHLQLASSSASVWSERFSLPDWLLAASEQSMRSAAQTLDAEPRRPIEETVEVTPVDAVFSLARTLTQPEAHRLGADGMMVAIKIRDDSGVRTVEAWSPTNDSEPDVFALLEQLHTLAWESLTRPESRSRLEELHTAISLGLPRATVQSNPSVIRLWGILSVYEDAKLQDLLQEMSKDGGVVDLSDVTHVATILAESFLAGGSSVHFVSPPRQLGLLSSAGVPRSNIHSSRREALAACQRLSSTP